MLPDSEKSAPSLASGEIFDLGRDMTKYFTIAIILTSIFFPQPAFAEDISNRDSGFLRLVNKDNRLSADYIPANLVEFGGVNLHPEMQKAFTQMQNAMQADGIYGLSIQSAYRSYAHQKSIFNQKVLELAMQGHHDAENMAAQSVQPPGASEHQLGLAIDVSTDGKLCRSFGETPAGKWLESHSHQYGFIVRYPASKTDITQIVYEPWHLRYVGTPHATIMKNLGLVLEEYLDYIQKVKIYMFWGEGEYYLVQHNPQTIPCETVDVSSLYPFCKDEYIITTRKTYQESW